MKFCPFVALFGPMSFYPLSRFDLSSFDPRKFYTILFDHMAFDHRSFDPMSVNRFLQLHLSGLKPETVLKSRVTRLSTLIHSIFFQITKYSNNIHLRSFV